MEDDELLRRYTSERSEAAFAELVRRHVDLVYSAALRQMSGNHHRAQEVTHMVFVILARKAVSLMRHPALPAWLYRSASFAAADLRRREARRKLHERAAALQSVLISDGGEAVEWSRIRPILDEAMNQLGERDREAIVLRYFAGRSFADIGRKLGISDNTARMRVERALDKLRECLNRRGINSTCVALAAGLSTETALAAPIGVATAATAAGMAAGASSSAGLLFFMSANKTAIGVMGLLVAAGAATVAVQEHANAQLAAKIAGLQIQTREFDALRQENLSLSRSLHEVRTLKHAALGGDAVSSKFKSLQAENAALNREITAEAARRRAAPSANGVVASKSYDLHELDRLPKPIVQVRPVYPAGMRAQNLGGQVEVDFVVDAAGNVQGAYAASSTQPEFEQPAVDAVSQWQFDPGQKGSVVVNTHMAVPIVFSIDNAAAAGHPTPISSTPPASPSPIDWFSGHTNEGAPFDIVAH